MNLTAWASARKKADRHDPSPIPLKMTDLPYWTLHEAPPDSPNPKPAPSMGGNYVRSR